MTEDDNLPDDPSLAAQWAETATLLRALADDADAGRLRYIAVLAAKHGTDDVFGDVLCGGLDVKVLASRLDENAASLRSALLDAEGGA